MKKLFTLFTLVLLVAVMFSLTASAGYIRPQPEEYTRLLDVDITLNFPIGEIKDGKLVYTRKRLLSHNVLLDDQSNLPGEGRDCQTDERIQSRPRGICHCRKTGEYDELSQ